MQEPHQKKYIVYKSGINNFEIIGHANTLEKAEEIILEARDELIQKYADRIELNIKNLDNKDYKQCLLKEFQVAVKNIHSAAPYTKKNIVEYMQGSIEADKKHINNFKGDSWARWDNGIIEDNLYIDSFMFR